MKNILIVTFILLAFWSCEKPLKIAYVDNGVVINDYKEKVDLEAEFEEKQKAFQKKFDSIDQAFNYEVQQFQIQAQKMSQVNAKKRYQELLEKKQTQDQDKQYESQNFQLSFQSKLDSIITKVKNFEKDYAKSKGFTFLLGTSDGQATVLYGSEEYDLTQIILDSLNSSYEK